MPGTILVVDDDAKVLDILNKSLSHKGHTVHLARSGEEALNEFKCNEPDVMVLDIALPDMDGREVFRIVRSVPGARDVPILFLSAETDPEVRAATLKSGAEDFLVKPFSLRELNVKVNKVLGEYEHKKALKEERMELESELSVREENYEQINKELKRQLLSMKTLFAVSQDLNRQLDFDEMINRFALTLVGELQISSVAVFAKMHEKDEIFHLFGIKGLDRERVTKLELDAESEFMHWLESDNAPQKVVLDDDEAWIERLPDVRLAIFEYVTPIIVKRRLKGIVFTGPKINGNEYSAYELDILRSICNSAGIGMDNARLFKELQNTYLSTVKALVSIIEAKDSYTKGHTERVADYSVALGKKLCLSREDLRDVAFAAVLHDIGKLLVYEGILNKPSSLNEDEWELLKQHPVVGAEIIKNMEFLSGTVAMVRHHHEQWDGSGYPDGLREENIPFGARIIAVADSFDAMTTDRSYRKGRSAEKALEILESMAGIQFDPEVVHAFVKLIRGDRFRPRDPRHLLATPL